MILIYTLEMKLNEPQNIILETFNPDDQQWKFPLAEAQFTDFVKSSK